MRVERETNKQKAYFKCACVYARCRDFYGESDAGATASCLEVCAMWAHMTFSSHERHERNTQNHFFFSL